MLIDLKVTISRTYGSVFAISGSLKGLGDMSLVSTYKSVAEGSIDHRIGALPPLASVTVVRVVNFTVYNAFKDIIADNVGRITGSNPLDQYNKPGSIPTVTGVLTFTTAGLIAGLVASPIACMFILLRGRVRGAALISK